MSNLLTRSLLHVMLISGAVSLVQRFRRFWPWRTPAEMARAPILSLQQIQSALIQAHCVSSIAGIALPEFGKSLRARCVELTITGAYGGSRVYIWSEPAGCRPAAPAPRRPAAGMHRRRFVIRAQGRVIGLLSVECRHQTRRLSPAARSFITGLLQLLAVTLHGALLFERLQEQVELLGERERALARLNAQLLQIQEDERRRLAFDLHDDALQRIILLEREFAEAPSTQQNKHWQRAVAEVAISLRAICASLRPPVLDDLGLEPALSWLINDVRARSDLEVDLLVHGHLDQLNIRTELAVALYRVSQEALSNCIKHSGATRVVVAVVASEDSIRLQITDNGCGYQHSGRDQQRPCFGIASMRERLRPFNGSLILCEGPMGGTIVTAIAPVQEG